MKKTLKLGGLYLLVTLVVALGVIFLVPMPMNNASSEDSWQDPLPPQPNNHLLDIVGNLMNVQDINIDAQLAITAGSQVIGLNANVALQARDNFADLAVTGAVAVQINDFNADLYLTYLNNTLYADWEKLHLSVNVPTLIDGLPQILALFGVDFTMPDFSELDVNAILELLEDYTETDNGNGWDIVLTVAGCDLQLTCDPTFNLQRAVIPALTLNDTTIVGEIALTNYPASLNITVPDHAYVDVPQLVQMFSDLMPVFHQPFAIAGNATLFATVDGVRQDDNYLTANLGRLAVATKNGLLDQLAIDLIVDGAGDLFTSQLNGRALDLGAYFNSDNTDGGVYINFDGLKLFCGKADLADTYAALQGLLSLFVSDDILQYTNLFYFNDNNDMVFDTALLKELMGNLTADEIVPMVTKYLPYLQGLTLDADNKLTLTVAKADTFTVTVTLSPAADGTYHLTVECNLAEQQRIITADFTLTTLDSVVGVPADTTGYLDVSDIDDLLNAVNNTVRYQEFYFAGTVGVSIASLLNVDVPVKIAINNTDPERGLVVAAHFALPYKSIQKMVLDSAPSATGKTQDGDRNLYLYYQQGNIYLYRTEQVKLEEWSWKQFKYVTVYAGSYEKAVKLTMTEFTDNALYWLLKWGFGFSDTIMNPINDAIANGATNTDPIDYGNIVHGFTNTDGRYDIVLNLGEITRNPDLKDFTVSVTTADRDGQTVVTNVGLDMQVDVGVKIVLQTRDNDDGSKGLKLSLGDGVADITTATERMTMINDRYTTMPLADGQTYYETIKGNWQAA